jgi:hypothetical protein
VVGGENAPDAVWLSSFVLRVSFMFCRLHAVCPDEYKISCHVLPSWHRSLQPFIWMSWPKEWCTLGKLS